MAKTESVSQQKSSTFSFGNIDIRPLLKNLRLTAADNALIVSLILLAFLSGLIIVNFIPLFSPGVPHGYSTLLHFFKVAELKKTVLDFGYYVDWSESWYNGHHQFLFYPPLFYLLATLVELIVDDIMLTGKLMAVAGVIVGAVTSYLMSYVIYRNGSRFWQRAVAASTSSMVFVFSPALISLIITRGKYPDYWAIALAPLCLALLINWIRFKRDKIPYGFAIMTAVVMLTHIDMAVTLIVISAVFSYVYLKVDLGNRGKIFDEAMNRPMFRLGLSYLAFTALTAFFWLPYLSYIDTIGALNQLYPSRLPMQFSSYLRGTFVSSRTMYPGALAGLMALSALFFYKKYKAIILSWMAVLVTGILLLSIQYTSLQSSFPELNTLFFRTSIATVVMAIAVLAGVFCLGIMELNWSVIFKGWAELKGFGLLGTILSLFIVAALFTGIYLDDAFLLTPEFIRTEPRFVGELSQVIDVLKRAEKQDTGRVLMVVETTPEATYLPALIDKPIVNGFEAQTSRIADDLDELRTELIADKSKRRSLINRLDKWGVEYILVNKALYAEELKNLEGIEGLTAIFVGNRYQVFRYQNAGYIRPEQAILAVGKGGDYTERIIGALPSVTMIGGKSHLIDNYDQEELERYESIILYGFETNNLTNAEAKLEEYVRGGGKLIMAADNGLSNLLPGDRFLGLKIKNNEFSGKPKKVSSAIPVKTSFESDGAWNGVYFQGPIKPLVKIDGKTVVGKRRMGRGEVTFVGYNLIYHAVYNDRDSEYKLLQELIGANVSKKKAGIEYSLISDKPGRKKFVIESDKRTWAQLAMSWSPYWRAYVNGKPVETKSFDNLTALNVPKGRSDVQLVYQNTLIHNLAIVLSVAAFVIILLTPLIRRKIVSVAEPSTS